MPSVQRSGGWYSCGLVKSHIWKSLPWDVKRRTHARTRAHTHAEGYIESKYVRVCLWTSNPYLYCEGRTHLKIIFKFMLMLYWTLAIVWCVFDTMYATFRKFVSISSLR